MSAEKKEIATVLQYQNILMDYWLDQNTAM
jgi:hypothetical protein